MKENLKARILFYFLLSFSSVHVHNDFLLAILTRCQIIISTPGIMCLVLKKLGIYCCFMKVCNYIGMSPG